MPPAKELSLLSEYRHWRASLPVGAFMVLSAYLLLVSVWPQVAAHPEQVFAQAAAPVQRLVSPPAVWLILIGISMMLGAWWGAVASWAIQHVQFAVARRLPLERSISTWSRWQRIRLSVSASEMQNVQNMMRATPDYADLLDTDQRPAFVGFIRESLYSPYVGLSESTKADEMVRSITDLRLLAGLLPWLPLSLVGLALNVEEPAPRGFVPVLFGAAFVATAALLQSVARQARAASTLAVHQGCTPTRLGVHARNAQGSGK